MTLEPVATQTVPVAAVPVSKTTSAPPPPTWNPPPPPTFDPPRTGGPEQDERRSRPRPNRPLADRVSSCRNGSISVVQLFVRPSHGGKFLVRD